MIEIEHLASCVQVLEIINEAHRQVIKEKDAAFALLNDNLQNREYENVVLQAQKDQDNITHLKISYGLHARNPGKDNINIIVWKHTTSAKGKYHDLLCYIVRIQRCKR